ncbi:MAG: replication protein [Candidatus Humimicrobiia bacterium]
MANKNNNNNRNGYKFQGIESPNYTQVPNIFLDELMSELIGSELKVLMYITRRTFGFGKRSDNISLNQIANGIIKKDSTVLDKGTGLSKMQIINAINKLVDKGIIIKVKRASENKGLEATNYSLKFKNDLFEPLYTFYTSPSKKTLIEQKKVIQNKETQQQKNVVLNSKKRKELIDKLIKLEVKKDVSESLIRTHDHKKIESYIDYVNQRIKKGYKIRSKPAYLIAAIKNNYQLPEIFKTENELKLSRQEKANCCFKENNNGDCLVSGSIRLKPWCDQCEKLKKK